MRFPGLLLLLSLASCAAASERECTVGADCATGACNANGECVAAAADSGAVDAPASDTAEPVDAATDAPAMEETDAPKLGCTPNNDGVINADEVPIAPGLKATFRLATNASFATAGKANPDGSRKWDLAGPLAGDKDILVTTRSIAGTWYGAKFPGASHATELSNSSDLLGVFQTTATALLLMGVVSPTDGLTKTELKYATPPPALQFPLKKDAAWKVTSNVSGTATGVASFYSETWDARVDAHGELVTPFGTFAVQRVRTVLTRQVGVSTTITRSFAFVTECYGTVATITSKPNELSEEFTSAAEIRRLAP